MNERAGAAQMTAASVPKPPFATDVGEADPRLLLAMRAFTSGECPGTAVLGALSQGRLLVPVMPVTRPRPSSEQDFRSDTAPIHSGEHTEMVTVFVEDPSGVRSLLAFTDARSMANWRRDARPVPVATRSAAESALTEGAQALLVNVAGPDRFVVAGDELRSLAFADDPGQPLHLDAAILAAVDTVVGQAKQVRRADLVPGPAGLQLMLCLAPGMPAERYRALMSWLGEQLADSDVLRSRLAAGLHIVVQGTSSPRSG